MPRASQTAFAAWDARDAKHGQRHDDCLVVDLPQWWLMVVNIYIYMCGWWGPPTPLKHDGVKVSWDHDIPN